MGLGLTPRGVGLTPVAMQMTASQGGISAIAAAQDQEEERKRRTEVIVGMMSTRWGFVSQEGVERCARRLGLECLWEEGMGEERKRTLTIAGNGVLVDVKFEGEEVKGVVLQFEGSSEKVVAGAGDAAEVLAKGLKGTREGYVDLEGFVGNLERLSSMDRLGGEEVNCFDAVDGIYRGLERVFAFELEKTKKREGGGGATEVLCRHSGQPKMHTKGRVGLALQYWMDRRLVSEKQASPEDMDIDKPEAEHEENDDNIYSAIIECEASPAELYPPIKCSDAWVSNSVEKPPSTEKTDVQTDGSLIDWQDPPPTLLSPTNGTTNLDLDLSTQPRCPDVRFIARFEPPIIVPLQTAIDIHASVNAPLSQESILPTTYESLIFADTDAQTPPTTPRTLDKSVISYEPSTETSSSHRHKSTLVTQPNDYARAITHLPFSHPRHIIALLPTLRQWALTASILRRSFVLDFSSESSSPLEHIDVKPTPKIAEPKTFQTIEDELADFMASPLPSDPAASASPAEAVRNIDISLTTTPPATSPTTPLPRFTAQFSNPRFEGKRATVVFSVGLNGVIEGVDVEDGRPSASANGAANSVTSANTLVDDERAKTRQKVKKVLEVSESIGVCVEWMSQTCSSSGS